MKRHVFKITLVHSFICARWWMIWCLCSVYLQPSCSWHDMPKLPREEISDARENPPKLGQLTAIDNWTKSVNAPFEIITQLCTLAQSSQWLQCRSKHTRWRWQLIYQNILCMTVVSSIAQSITWLLSPTLWWVKILQLGRSVCEHISTTIDPIY